MASPAEERNEPVALAAARAVSSRFCDRRGGRFAGSRRRNPLRSPARSLFGFEQHRAQGTTLIAMVPPTGLLAFVNYASAHQVDWRVGLLLMPGVFLGGVAGARLALRLAPQRMRLLFAALVFLMGAFEVYDSLLR